MGSIMPPSKNACNDEEIKSLSKSIDGAIDAISNISQLQMHLLEKNNFYYDNMPNSGRIILFTPAKHRDLIQIQENFNNSILEYNKKLKTINNRNK